MFQEMRLLSGLPSTQMPGLRDKAKTIQILLSISMSLRNSCYTARTDRSKNGTLMDSLTVSEPHIAGMEPYLIAPGLSKSGTAR